MIERDVENSIVEKYRDMFPISEKLHKKLINYIPGGATRSLSYFKPYPIHISYGEGSYVYTHEGHKLFDVTNAYGALIHGHGDMDVANAVKTSIMTGSQFAAPTDAQYRLSKLLCERVPSFDKIRFCNSGTEATLFALRTARTFTGKDKILKMSGGFHGTHDCVAASTKKNVVTAGIPSGMTEDMIEVPFNDFKALEETVKANQHELAAVIMEPFLGAGGIILPDEGYLRFVREITEKYETLLIFDEIFSFRVHAGGCQALYNVIPDITTVGKIVGGGLPIGVFGGKDEIMKIYCHEKTDTPLYHSGTFNGYETVMQAGYAALAKLDSESLKNLNALGAYFHDQLIDVFKKRGLNIQVNQIGSVLNIHFVNEPVKTAESALQSEEKLLSLMHLSLLTKGIYSIPRALYILSTNMTEPEIDHLSQAIDETLSDLYPLIEKNFSHLLL